MLLAVIVLQCQRCQIATGNKFGLSFRDGAPDVGRQGRWQQRQSGRGLIVAEIQPGLQADAGKIRWVQTLYWPKKSRPVGTCHKD